MGSLESILGAIALIEATVYGVKAAVVYGAAYVAQEKASREARTFVKLPCPADIVYGARYAFDRLCAMFMGA